ncbi:ATP synthase protein I [Kerstersia gyiorum]|jgi:ATP synthase protein I|uniref:ATP synthase protein I n=2 Tax=Kerstersia gyiorum TaxID=206506 RepID=A0A171KRV2_9BURK|nr:ATP synthase subunit I [Kerstersia gyiorum]AZV92531.1 hypothetical protein CBF45_01320 [Bordetella sp. J329]KAB0542455.1 hypothetical protein F7P85_12635 [Kerstersia gyiorum]KKO71619.1 hypothetical protein AAV32_10530 [Kerstersia gyiorum]MCR4160329.1 ATP synthase subunit I [Kerstersia gyiorum]QBR39458.1 hypothetical protein EHF36_01510 [Kerstersia gyiorum]
MQGQGTEPRLMLTATERTEVALRARKELAGALVAQVLMGSLAVVLSWLIAGAGAGVSALIGAGAYLLPSAIFILRLMMTISVSGQSSPVVFILGQAFKLLAAIALLWWAASEGGDGLVWPALLAGLICALKGPLLWMLFRSTRWGRRKLS